MEKGYVFAPYIIADKISIIDNKTDFFRLLKIKQRKKKIEKIMGKLNDRQ